MIIRSCQVKWRATRLHAAKTKNQSGKKLTGPPPASSSPGRHRPLRSRQFSRWKRCSSLIGRSPSFRLSEILVGCRFHDIWGTDGAAVNQMWALSWWVCLNFHLVTLFQAAAKLGNICVSRRQHPPLPPPPRVWLCLYQFIHSRCCQNVGFMGQKCLKSVWLDWNWWEAEVKHGQVQFTRSKVKVLLNFLFASDCLLAAHFCWYENK